MSAERLTQTARAVLDAWSDAGWTTAFDAARRALRAEVEAAEALAAAPVEPSATAAMLQYLPERLADHTATRVDNAGDTPNFTLIKVKLGRHHEYQLYENEAYALWLNLGKALGSPAPQPQQAGLSPQQEPKYTVNGHAIVNRASGEEIPADEPVFIFRARDKYAASIIGDYANTFCTDPEHRAAVEERFIQFGEWAEKHPERMKEPDTAATPPQPTAPAPQAQAVSQWQGIESAPKDGKDLLIHTKDGLTRLAFFDRARGGVWSCWPGRENMQATHWMPLPEAPASAAQKEPTCL